MILKDVASEVPSKAMYEDLIRSGAKSAPHQLADTTIAVNTWRRAVMMIRDCRYGEENGVYSDAPGVSLESHLLTEAEGGVAKLRARGPG